MIVNLVWIFFFLWVSWGIFDKNILVWIVIVVIKVLDKKIGIFYNNYVYD